MLVDANVFKGYFQAQLGKSHVLCGCPLALFEMASTASPIFHDTGRLIEHEWERVVDRDWFEAWLSSSLQSGLIQYLQPIHDMSVEKELKSVGFPSGRDIVYVRMGVAVSSKRGSCRLFTEDMDFYDPKRKGCSAPVRQKILKASAGPVCKALSKRKISVLCVP